MKAVRVNEPGGKFVVEELTAPAPAPGEVVVEIKAAAILPNMAFLLGDPPPFPVLLPPTPYTLGCGGATGVVKELGDGVQSIRAGDRVFISEVLACGDCAHCRGGWRNYCDSGSEMGLFAYTPKGEALLAQHRDGALSELASVPAQNLARLPGDLDLDKCVRLGYWSIAHRGMKVRPDVEGQNVAIVGATGHMGLGATFIALARGASRVFVIARNKARLEELRSVDAKRITALSVEDGEVSSRLRAATGERGVDLLVDAQGFAEPTTTLDALKAVGKRANVVFVGGVQGDVAARYDWYQWSGITISGSLNYLMSDVEELANLMAAGVFPLERIEIKSYSLDEVRKALNEIGELPSAFHSPVIHPQS